VFASGLYNRRYFARAARIAVEHDCDVVHLMNFAQPARAVKRAHPQSQVVLHMHCDWLSQLNRRLVRSRAEHVDLVVGCSRYVTGRAQAVLPDLRCETLPNGVDVEAFHTGPDAPVRANPRVLFVGRVSPDKGVHVLIETLAGQRRSPEIERSWSGRRHCHRSRCRWQSTPRSAFVPGPFLRPGRIPAHTPGRPARRALRKGPHTPWVGRDALPGL
jgi:hypothetical protein